MVHRPSETLGFVSLILLEEQWFDAAQHAQDLVCQNWAFIASILLIFGKNFLFTYYGSLSIRDFSFNSHNINNNTALLAR